MEIDQQLEQRINIKLIVKLGKSGPEIYHMLQQAYWGEKKEQFSSGCSVIEKAQKIPRTTKGQGPLPLCAAMKTSIECILLCSVTAG
jgi:hypothetical protein